ncbi:hypothetical protein [Methanococcoides sp. NM1]|nr:hypothetical protein [Methanococcoides sp. NM1]
MIDVDEERIDAVFAKGLKDHFEVGGETNCYFCYFKGICEWWEVE